MTTVELTRPTKLHGGSISWWDPAGECRVTVAEPPAEPDLFAAYHAGAIASYARFGVGDALDDDTARCAADTVLFWTITSADGHLVGGVRAKGPLASPDDSHAVVEWEDRPGEAEVRNMIADRVPFGVVEVKAAWLTADGSPNRGRAKLIARCGFHATAILGIDYFMATSAPHILDQWKSSGGVVADIPATPYPDERYQTKMMWWDRKTFRAHGDRAQVAATLAEMALVRRRRRTTVHRNGHPFGPDRPMPTIGALTATSTHRLRAADLVMAGTTRNPGRV